MRRSVSWQERFWRFCPPAAREREDGCWEWLGSVDGDGYGRLNRGRQGEGVIRAHRASWIIHNPGKQLRGKFVLHSCANRWCVNPDHLFLGTQSEANKTSPKTWGYRSGMDNPNCKLTDQQVEMIRRFAARDVRQKELARAFGVAEPTIQGIVSGRRRSLGAALSGG